MLIRRYIENVAEELDYPNEYFFDAASGLLYYFHNATGAPPPSTVFVTPILSQLFVLEGSQVRCVCVFILHVFFSSGR